MALLLVAALALGIGYAGFTSELSIGGEAILLGVSESKVVIQNVDIVDVADSSGAHIVAAPDGLGTKAATIDVSGFAELDEFARLTVVVENPHAVPVALTIKDLVINNNDAPDSQKYFDIQYEEPVLPTEIAAHSIATFHIMVTAKYIPANAHTTSFTVGITATTR